MNAPIRLSQRTAVPRCSRGFTLLELIMVIVLLGILGTVGSTMFADSYTTGRLVNAENAAVSRARYAMERLANEIRTIKYDAGQGQYLIATPATLPPPPTPPTPALALCPSSSFSFTNDADAPVTITCSGTTLSLNGHTLVGDVSVLGLSFLDEGLTPTSDKKKLRYVRIHLTVAPADVKAINQRTLVALRLTK
ncbi:pilus assembly FimT family protein [Rhodocyclus purpureus]|uniref:pilus assembly FimT family protein n=1 Tax=Rhodocyclus purpureus TaxID=1067 RepID=UPI00191284EC|nr:prepilin-type N-terminal cleavage/methylation domain-containing protein [Rhodocyclus purpureus]MBK5912975.1 hypothetical protein [Rhodocyclus purpureus]